MLLRSHCKWFLWVSLLSLTIFLYGCTPTPLHTGMQSQASPVKASHISKIKNLFVQNHITEGYAERDRYGRVELRGGYQDEREVDLAFSLAQTVVGIKWVSPVTPENIKVKEWERELSEFFKRAGVIKPGIRGDIPPGPVRNKYALVVGIGKFKNEKISTLYAAGDATAFYQYLINPKGGGFPSENVTLLLDEQGIKDNIAKALDKIKNIAEGDDLVCIYMSSHGTPPEKFGGVFIVTYDSVVKPRQDIWHTSVSEEMLKNFVQGLRAKRLIMIIDACYSNGAYKKIPGFLPAGGKSLGIEDEEEGYGLSEDYGKRLLGAKDIVIKDAPHKPFDIPGEVPEPGSWGRVLVSASGAGEKSWESEQLHQSYFTYYFLEGLRSHDGASADAFYDSKPKVIERVRLEKQHDQTPQVVYTRQNWNIPIGM